MFAQGFSKVIQETIGGAESSQRSGGGSGAIVYHITMTSCVAEHQCQCTLSWPGWTLGLGTLALEG